MADLPGSVHFVSQAPGTDIVRLLEAVLAAKVAPLGAAWKIAVLDQCRRSFGSARTQVGPHQGSGAHHLAPGEKLVGAELIRLDGVPCAIENARTFCARTDTVHPVVARNEVAARITYDRHTHRFDFGCHVFAVTLRICQRRSRLINAPVHSASEVFDEATKKSPIDHRPDAGGIDHHSVRRLSPKQSRCRK